MKPTKGRTLIKKTADDLGVSESLTQDVVDFYYSTVRKKIEGMKHTTIFLHGLGTLRLSRVKLKRDITGLKKLLSSNEQEDFKKVIKYKFTQEQLTQKEEALENCNKYYEPLYEKRNKNLEIKRTNPGRDKE